MGNFDRAEERLTAMQSDALAKKAAAEERAAEAHLKAMEMDQRRMELLEKQLALQEAQAATMAEQVARTAPRENPNYKPSGPYTNPATGEPWAKELPYDIYQNNIHLNRGWTLTQTEVEQLRRLKPLEQGIIKKVDNSVVRAKVIPTYDAQNRLNRIVISYPMGKDDNPQMYPPLDEMARQLADQAELVTA